VTKPKGKKKKSACGGPRRRWDFFFPPAAGYLQRGKKKFRLWRAEYKGKKKI